MKWWAILVRLPVIAFVLLVTTFWPYFPVQKAYASPQADVLITAIPFIPPIAVMHAPTNLTVTQAGSDSFIVSWTPDPLATITVLRLGREEYPTTNTTGELIYASAGTSVTLTGYSLESFEGLISAWSENATASSVDYATVSAGGGNMTFVWLIGLGGILSFLALRSNSILMGFAAAAAWLVSSYYATSNPPTGFAAGSAAQTGLMLAFLAIAAAVPLTVVLRGRGASPESYYEDEENGKKSGGIRRFFSSPSPERNIFGGRKQPNGETLEEYRMRVNRALHPRRRRR